jgi:gliding motility-associated-like protein
MKAYSRLGMVMFMLLAPLLADAQWDYPQFNMSQTTITNCFGRLYDSGGPTASYGLNESITTTIAADGIVTLTFYGAFSLQENVDFLTLYDGTEATGSLLGIYTGQQSPGQLVATSGTVTLVFTSDGSISTAGFSCYWSSEVALPVPPGLTVPNPPACQSTQFNVELSSPVPCSWFDDAEFIVNSSAEAFEVISIDANCAAGMTDLITLNLDHALTYNCNILVNLTLRIPDACGNPHVFELGTSFLFDNCPINAEIVAVSPSVCPGGCTSLQVLTQGCFNYSYAWSNGLLSTAGPHTICPAVTTTYSVVITELETQQQLTQTITISLENVEIFTPDQTVCQSAPEVLLQAGVAGNWSGPGVAQGSTYFNPDSAGEGTHRLYFNSANCVDSMEITVTPIAAQPAAAACPGSALFQLNAIPAGGIWSGIQVDPTGMFDPSTPGTFQAMYEVNGCIDITEVNVDTIAGPYVLDPACQSVDQITLDVSPFGGFWSGPGIVNPNAGTFNPSNATPGNVVLNYAINGCAMDFSIFVKDIDILASEVLCPLEAPAVLDATPIPFGGLWASPDGAITNATSGTFNPGVFTEDTETYITYQALNGCVDTMYITIVSPQVEVEELSFCVTGSVVNLNEELVGNVNPAGGSWLGPGINGSAASGFTLNPQALPVGLNYIYYLSNSCEDSVMVRIFSPNLPDAPQNFCSSDSPVILASTVPGGSWSGSGIVDAETGLFDPSAAEEGSYYVHWTNPAGCGDSILVTVERVVEPVISGINDVYCNQDYEVNFSTTPVGGLLVGSLASNTFNPSELSDGEYTVIYKIVPDFCPETADTAEFTVYPPLSLEPLVASDNPVCFEQTCTISADVNGGYDGNTITYAWSNGGPNTASNTQAYTESVTVSLLVDDGCSNPQTTSIDITVFPRFDFSATTSDTLCPGEEGTVQLTFATFGNYTVEWNGEVGNSSLYTTPAGSDVEIVITDSNGCERDTSVSVPAYTEPLASFTIVPDELCVSFENMDNIELVNNAVNAVSGTWYFGDGSTAAMSPGQGLVHAYQEPGQYTLSLQMENEGGCTDSTSLTLCIQPQDPVFVPDIFSPNEDGKNDTLFVRGLFISRMEFRVYSRWGEVVFESSSPTLGWDGQIRGSQAPSGSYYYTLMATIGGATKIERVGEVVLIR